MAIPNETPTSRFVKGVGLTVLVLINTFNCALAAEGNEPKASLFTYGQAIVAGAVALSAFGFFLYKLIAGSLMASASVRLEIRRQKSLQDAGSDTLGVTIEVERNNSFSIGLLGGDVRVTHYISGGRIVELDAPIRVPLQVIPLHLKNRQERDADKQVWERRTRSDPGRPYREYRYSLAPSDKASFAVLLPVPPGCGCRIEANIAYEQWGWFPDLSRGALMASAISFAE